jgi:hypothetical protein
VCDCYLTFSFSIPEDVSGVRLLIHFEKPDLIAPPMASHEKVVAGVLGVSRALGFLGIGGIVGIPPGIVGLGLGSGVGRLTPKQMRPI